MDYTGISGIICGLFVGLLVPSLQAHFHCLQRRSGTFIFGGCKRQRVHVKK